MEAGTARLDVITTAILRAKLEAVVDDMAATLTNVARSDRISTARSFACAVLDEDGDLISIDNPLHVSTVVDSAASCLDYYQFSIAADDVIITNDPYSGGSTLHYVTIVAPLGVGDDIVAYLVVQAHMIDMGGVVMGNYHPGATELWAEGVRFTPIKVIVDGKTRRHVMDTLTLNSRDPEGFRGDVDAVVATANIGRRRLLEIIHDYGLADVLAAMRSSVEYVERRFRSELSRIPDGSYDGEAVLDHDGQGREDLTVRVELRKRGQDLVLDFAGTDEQSTGFVNSQASNTRCYALLPLLGLIDETVPMNSGLMRAVEIITKPGTLVDTEFPTPTGWSRDHVGFEIAEAVNQALAKALPAEAGLVYASRQLVQAIAKDVVEGDVEEQLSVVDLAAIAQTGAPGRDGADGWGQPGPASRGRLPSIEEFEAETEVTVARLEYREDSGGAGKWRGGLGTETVLRFSEGSLDRLYACLVGQSYSSPGYAGGAPGGPASASLAKGDSVSEPVPGVILDEPLGGGAELMIRTTGGGGWGVATERSIDRVASDVRNGYVSPQAARSVYGVVMDPGTMEVDEQATSEERGTARVGLTGSGSGKAD